MPTPLHVLAPAVAGGTESVVRMLTAALVRGGTPVHAHMLVDPGCPPPLAADLQAVGVQVHVTEVPHRRYGVERRATRELCRRLAVDVVHCHGYRPDVIDAPEARRLGIPVVSTVHGFTGGGWRNAVYEWLQFRALRRMDRVLAVSEPLVELLTRRGVPRDRIRLVPNAYAPERPPLAPREARAALGLDADGPVVGWIGRMSMEKGPDVFVEAARRADRADVCWVMIGDGPERESTEAAIREGGADVRLAGLVPDAARLVRAFDLLVLSSRTEGTPIVLFEAMAAGVPVIATRVGGVPDVVGRDAGVLVDAERPDDIAAVAVRLLDDGARSAALAAAARRRITERYGVEPWARTHLDIYAEVCGGR